MRFVFLLLATANCIIPHCQAIVKLFSKNKKDRKGKIPFPVKLLLDNANADNAFNTLEHRNHAVGNLAGYINHGIGIILL